ncbi:MAG: YeeE/YedE family protein [Gemmatimonadota bacterium]
MEARIEAAALTGGRGAARGRSPGVRPVPAVLGILLLGTGAWLLRTVGWRQAALFGVGGLLGLVLYGTSFGFTSGYRRAVVARDGSSVYAQLLMLGAATLLFAPILASGSVLGRGVTGAYAPAAAQVLVGAFLFGIGMQLGGGCGSGTLYGVGGGSLRTLVTLLGFIAGAFRGSLDMGFWRRLPSAGTVTLGSVLGWPLAVALQLVALALVALWIARRERAGAGRDGGSRPVWRRMWRENRLLVVGGLALALLNFATLLLAGHPWTITWAFTLWGAKSATLLGWDPGASAYWTSGFARAALAAPVARDVTSVMDIGIILGAAGTAAWLGRLSPLRRIPVRSLLAAALGGLLLGYGARIAFGCNIGAFFSGVASTSLHGWMWIAAAIPGTWVGVRLRPWFGLANEAPACA